MLLIECKVKLEIIMEKIYLYKTANKSIAYDDEHWYIDNNPQQQNEGDGFAQFKEYATSEAFRLIANDISKYTSHFKNVAVLTAAGTSMENGIHGGKTRTELWQSYEDEINAIKASIRFCKNRPENNDHLSVLYYIGEDVDDAI